MRDHKLAEFRLARLAAVAVVLFAMLAPPACAQGQNLPTPAPCDCTHLTVLQAELRNAKLLEQRYRAEAERLRNMSSEQARTAYAEFLKTSGNGLEWVPGGDTKSIDYQSAGDLMDWATVTSGLYSDAQLCARSQNSENDLKDGIARAACRGIGDALRAHEDFHVETCERMGYRAHFFMHRSELATDEAEAYGRDVASLKTIIARILEEAEPRVLFFSKQNFGGVLDESSSGETRPIAVTPIDSRGEFLLRGSGELSTTMTTTEPGCSVGSGSSYKQPLSTYLTTDGLTAWVRAAVTPALHVVDYRCSDGTRLTGPPPPPRATRCEPQARRRRKRDLQRVRSDPRFGAGDAADLPAVGALGAGNASSRRSCPRGGRTLWTAIDQTDRFCATIPAIPAPIQGKMGHPCDVTALGAPPYR